MKTSIVLETAIQSLFLTSHVFGAPNVRDNNGTLQILEEGSSFVCKTSQKYFNLSTFDFDPRSVLFDDTACLSMQMFKEMGLVKHFHIPPENLYRFILRAQEGYRNIPYHNWDHGFAVLHFTYAVLKSCNHTQNNCFTSLEGLALLTAAMCHDLDHPGTTSQYQEAINSDLAQKYRGLGSILERHHIEKTLSIFEHPGTNFIAQLSETEHKEFIDLVRQIILATDLKKHFQVLLEEQTMASEGYNRTNARHRELLRSVVISSADLSDLTKGRRTARKSAKLVNMEFFDQGDKEKAMGLLPLKMMDRTHTNIAEEQAKFISKVVMPVYRVLAALCPEVQGCINKLENNLQFWQNAMSYFEEQSNRNRSQLEILEDVELDKISLFRKTKNPVIMVPRI